MTDNKRIVKNTLFLYIRMFLIMGVSLFTSRVVLDKLGIEDYALYNVVGGIVGMLSFLSGTLSIGTSRFLTYEIGAGDKEKLYNTFSTSFYTHLALALIIVLLLETGGLWFMYNKLIIPTERLNACFWVLQISILTMIVSVTQVPYTSAIMAYEKMGIYAYVSIFEASAKLGICYLLSTITFDRLILYAILMALVQIIVAMYNRYYCVSRFESCRLSMRFDKKIFRSLMGFSGWNILANLTETLKLQGVIIIINMFLSPVVVASQALANQVSSALMQFVNNFRLAINPQIIKLYAAGDKDASKKLTLETTVYCFDLILMLALPCIYCMKTIMGIWLVEVPEYAVLFTQAILVCNIIGTFGAAFYIPMMAANKIRTNSIAAIFLGIGQFIILYLILRFGGGPLWVPLLSLVMSIGFSLFVKPYVLWREIDYSLNELGMCYWSCLKVALLAIALSSPFKYILDDSIQHALLLIVITIIAVAISALICMGKENRLRLTQFVLNRTKK